MNRYTNTNKQEVRATYELLGNGTYEEWLEGMVISIHLTAEQRVINWIKETAEQIGVKVGMETLIKHGLTLPQIAMCCLTHRQTVSLVLKKLQESNKIHFRPKRILVRDIEGL